MPPFDIISFRRTVALKMEEVGVAALSVAVSNRKALLYSEGFGVENAERPVLKTTVNTRFKIASCSKMITAALRMRLVDRGFCRLMSP